MSQVGASSGSFDRTLEDLTDEAETSGNFLNRTEVDNLYIRRGIGPDQALAIEKALKSQGIEIRENGDIAAEELVSPSPSPVSHDTALNHLIAAARRYPLLNADEEAACGEAIQRGLQMRETQKGERTEIDERIIAAGERAHKKLVNSNIRLVVKFAFEPRYRNRMDIDDLVQMGLIGLMRAAEKFDPSLEFRFSTYASWWIQQGMSRGIADHGRTIRLPVHMIERISKFRRASRAVRGESKTKPSVKRIAEALGWDDAYTARIAQISEMHLVSLDAGVGPDNDTPLVDLIADDALDPEALTVKGDTASHVRAMVDELEDDRLRDIVHRRFGFDGAEETLESVGESYGVTRERIRQLESKALKILTRRAKQKKLGSLKDGSS